MHCPHCAAEIPDGSRFCGRCGQRTEPTSPAAAAPGSAPDSAPGSPRARLLAVLLMDVVLASAGVAMIVSYVHGRDAAQDRPAVSPAKDPEPAPMTGAAPAEAARAMTGAGPEPAWLTREVAARVDSHRPELERCYQRALARDLTAAPPEGRLHVRLELPATGREPRVAVVKNTLDSESLASCVVDLFASWTFPAPPQDQPLAVTWPLQFKAPDK